MRKYKTEEERQLARKISVKKYNDKVKEQVREIKKEYSKNYREQNPDKIKIQQINYKKNNLDKIKEINKKYIKENKEIRNEYSKEYYYNNKEYYKNKNKEYRNNNKDKIREYQKKYTKERKQSDSLFKLKILLRISFNQAFKRNNYTKKSKTQEILGCSFEEFKNYLESKFESWMNWDNHGLYDGTKDYGWDIDHMIPLTSAITEEDVIRLNHHTNLQPLCSKINRDIKKGNY